MELLQIHEMGKCDGEQMPGIDNLLKQKSD